MRTVPIFEPWYGYIEVEAAADGMTIGLSIECLPSFEVPPARVSLTPDQVLLLWAALLEAVADAGERSDNLPADTIDAMRHLGIALDRLAS